MDAVRYLYADDWIGSRPVIAPDTSPGALPGACTTVQTAPLLERVALDAVQNVSPWAHPALSVSLGIDHTWHVPGAYLLGVGPAPTYTATPGASSLPTSVPTFTQCNTQGTLSCIAGAPSAWQPLFGLFAYTEHAGDAITFTTNAQQVAVRLAGYTAAGQGLESGMLEGPGTLEPTAPLQSAHVRNGAVVAVVVDGQVLEMVNTWHHNPTATIYLLDGDVHTITLVHSGQHDPIFRPISRPKPLVTTTSTPAHANTMLLELQLGGLQVATYQRASWRAVAETGSGGPQGQSTWSLYRTLPGQAETLAPNTTLGGLWAGVHYEDVVPGCNVYVGTGQALWAGDSVTFSTDVLQMAIENIEFGWGDSLGPCQYTSAPVYVEADDVQFFLAEWFENEAWGSFSVEAGHIREDCTVVWEPAYTVTTARTSKSWTLSFAGVPTGGTFTLSFRGQTTAPIAYSPVGATTAGNIQTALVALETVGAGNITVAAQSPTAFGLLDAGALGGQYLPDIGVDATQMTPAGTMATVAETPFPPAARIQDTPLDPDTDLPGTNVGHAGLMGAPRGQYLRWTLAAPSVAAQLPYARDLAVFYWPPERDLAMVRKLPLGEDIVLGPVLAALVGTFETFLCTSYFDAQRLVLGATVRGASDEYLALYGQDLGLPQYQGEPPQSYRRRLAAAFSSGQDGGSLPFIASRLAELVFGDAQDPVITSRTDQTSDPTTTEQVMASCAEANPVGSFTRQVQVWRDVANMPPQSYFVTMPLLTNTLPYQGLPAVPPAQVKQIVENYLRDILNPVAAVIDLYGTSFHVIWQF